MVLLLNNVKHFPCIIHNIQVFVYETICNILKSIICNALEISDVSISKLYFLKKKPTWLQSPRKKKHHLIVLRMIMITDLILIVILFSASFRSSFGFGMYKHFIA